LTKDCWRCPLAPVEMPLSARLQSHFWWFSPCGFLHFSLSSHSQNN